MQPALTAPLREIICDPDLQPRVAGIDADHVRQLEGIAETWPPLKVVKRGERYVLVDGFHRLAAAQNLGLKQVQAELMEVPADGDLASLAFALNAAHGKPLTLSDRRAFAARLLRKHPDLSDRETGRRAGLVQPTIAKIRQDLEQQSAIPPAEKRKGRDGRNYPANPGSARKVELSDAIASMATAVERATLPAERIAQRELARYLLRVADVIAEQDALTGFATIEAAATACRAALGDERAEQLASRLGWAARNIVTVAEALGDRGDEDAAP
ncbi:MAG: ParB N-terminal domain-containing protein [Bradyrhizobium sp.]